MTTYTFPYGDGAVIAQLDERQVLGVLRGNHTPPLPHIPTALWEALNHPIDSLPLRDWVRPGQKVVLIISDMSRFWMRQDLVIPPLVSYLETECGLRAEDLTILVANGTHIGGDEADLRRLVTDDVYQRVAVVNHRLPGRRSGLSGRDGLRYACMGTPSGGGGRRVICLGACTHHVMAGFGGGRKSILPGISGIETIRHNHALALDPQEFCTNPLVGNGVLENNPLHLDMCQAAGMMPALFMVNLVHNEEMELSSIFAGHYMNSWLAACREADRIYRVPVPEKAVMVIASCRRLSQGHVPVPGNQGDRQRGVLPAPGGTLVLVIEAREGGGRRSILIGSGI